MGTVHGIANTDCGRRHDVSDVNHAAMAREGIIVGVVTRLVDLEAETIALIEEIPRGPITQRA